MITEKIAEARQKVEVMNRDLDIQMQRLQQQTNAYNEMKAERDRLLVKIEAWEELGDLEGEDKGGP